MIRYGKITGGAIEYAPMRHGGLMTSEGLVLNPKAEDFAEAGYYEIEDIAEDGEDAVVDGVLVHYIGKPVEYTTSYEEKVVSLIRERYTLDEELAILRQRDSKPEEFAEYNAYCENCKTKAKEEV